jgi:hypothetical protein
VIEYDDKIRKEYGPEGKINRDQGIGLSYNTSKLYGVPNAAIIPR